MEQLGYILLQVDAGDADPPCSAVNLDGHPAVLGDGLVVLGDLVPFHEIGIGVVLAIELGVLGDGAVQGQAGHHHEFYRLSVDDRKHTGHTQADWADHGIGR